MKFSVLAVPKSNKNCEKERDSIKAICIGTPVHGNGKDIKIMRWGAKKLL